MGFLKEKTKTRTGNKSSAIGDAWTYAAIERHSRLVLAWPLGKENMRDTIAFTGKPAAAMSGNFQVATEDFAPYKNAIVLSLGAQGVDIAHLVKMHATTSESEVRNSPAQWIGCKATLIFGLPDWTKINTSHVERLNLTVRMLMWSISYEAYECFQQEVGEVKHATLSLYFAWYNLFASIKLSA